MRTRRLASFVTPITLIALAAACSSSDDSGKPGPSGPGDNFTLQEDGVYRYVFGVDKANGRFITGGAHEVIKVVKTAVASSSNTTTPTTPLGYTRSWAKATTSSSTAP